jgi:hypothetical protein
MRPLLLALLASPRARGSNARLLSAFLRACRGWRVKRVPMARLRVAPYGAPRPSPRSRRRDPMDALVRDFDRADAVVLAAPVYFYGFPAQAKAVIDRCQDLWLDPRWRRRPKRPAFFLATCARPRLAEFAVIRREARAFLNTIGFKVHGELLLPGSDRSDAPLRLRRAQVRAGRLALALNALRPAPPKTHG